MHVPPDEPESARRVPRRVWRGTLFLALGRVWGSACTLATLFLLSRHLEGGDYGRLTFYLVVFQVLDSLVDFGTGQTAIERTAADPARVPEVLAAARRVRLLMGATGVVLVGGGALALGERGAGWILLASFYPMTHACELSTLVLRNRITLGIPVAVRAFAAALSLTLVLVLRGAGDREPAHYVLAIAVGSATANFLLHFASRRHLPQLPAGRVELGEFFRTAALLGIASLCQQGYFYVDNLFVRPLCGEAELGRYNTAMRVLSYGIMIVIYATQAALPWLSRAHARGELDLAVARLLRPMLALGLAGAALTWPFAGRLLWLFNPDFVSATASLRWLLLAMAVVYAGACLMTALVAAGARRAILVIAATALALNVTVNALLVPRLGIEGAAIATLATEVCVAIGAWIALRRLVRGARVS